MRGKDLIAATLFGGAGGSSGGGGGSAAVSPKEVNFYDYDGTCVHAYTVAEAQALSALPAGPEHPGLVFQGWNWSLEGVKGLTRAMNIGAMYTTDDGTTRLYITLQEGRTSPMLGVGVNGTVTVDWGDGTEPDVLTGTSVSTTKWTPNHVYANPGDYVIRLTVDGEINFTGDNYGNGGCNVLRHASSTDVRNLIYQKSLRRVEIGEKTGIASDAFKSCSQLEVVTIPSGVSYIFQRTFDSCYGLKFLVFPDTVTRIPGNTCSNCYSLKNAVLPEFLISIGTYAFQRSESPSMFCIPNGVTELGNYMFYESAIVSIIIPSSIVKLGYSTFDGCFGVCCFDFTACTAVPTLTNTNAFANIPTDCEIRVPAALYDEWIAATNWATYASKIKAY